MNKKGVIEELGSLVVPLVAIAIILTVGFLIFSEAKDKVVSITAVSGTATNVTIVSFTTGVYQQIGNSANCMALSCPFLWNGTATGKDALSTSIYTCTPGAGLRVDNTTTLNESLVVTYVCAPTTIAYNATGTIQNATQDIPGWLPIIVITIIGGLLIGLVAFFRR